MMPKNFKIPFGKSSLRVSLPADRISSVIENKKSAVSPHNIKRLVSESFKGSGEGLEKLISGKKKVLVVVPDATRSAHLKELLPHILKRIKGSGRTIDIVVATGLHKQHSLEQLKALLGISILKAHKVTCHNPTDGALADFGRTKGGVPIFLNKGLKSHDFIISIGVIEPHLYAGYSGGAKTIAVGLAGEETINATHGIRFLDDNSTKIATVRDNPFQNTLWDIISPIPVGFSINIVNDQDGKPKKIFFGDIKTVFEKGVTYAKGIFEVEADMPEDIVICGIGHPKDVNLYQASRAINYILNVDSPVLKKGGILIIAAELRDGIGYGLSEKRFCEALINMGSARALVNRIRRTGCVAGVHRAYMVAKALLGHEVIFVTRNHQGFMKYMPFPFFENMNGAIRHADEILRKKSRIHIIPRALLTVANVIRRRRK